MPVRLTLGLLRPPLFGVRFGLRAASRALASQTLEIRSDADPDSLWWPAGLWRTISSAVRSRTF